MLQLLAPGPPTLPVVGSLPFFGVGQLAETLGPPPHRRLAELAAQHGDVMTVEFGREPWTVLSSPEAVHEAFVTKGGDFAGRPMVPSMSISSGGGSGFARSIPNRELQTLRRTAFGQLFSEPAVRAKSELFEDEALRLADHLVAAGSSSPLRGSLRHCIANMVIRYAFSARVPYPTEKQPQEQDSEDADSFAALLDVTDRIWSELSATPTTVLDLLGTSADSAAYGSLRELISSRDELLTTLIRQRRLQHEKDTARGGEFGGGDMLDVLLRSGLPDSDVLYTLVDLFVAGVNTVSTTLEWQLLLTTQYPLVQSRARAEEARTSSRRRQPASSSSSSSCSAYTSALTKEVLRAKPPLLLPRMALTDTTIGGYHIPKGRVIYPNNWALTHSEKHWHSPNTFRPERWLEEEKGFETQVRGAAACKFIPFSIGQRVCPGSKLAQAELDCVSRVLFRSLKWSKPRGVTQIDLAEDYGLTLSPAKEQGLRFERVQP